MPNVMFVSTQNYEVLLRYKLCYHIKPDNPANFYILQEKNEKSLYHYVCAMVWPTSTQVGTLL